MNEMENVNTQQEVNAQNGQQQLPPPPSNLVWAILTTIFCCLPLGIVAIIKASKVNGLYVAGQYEAALAASKDAKKWSMIGIGCGLAGIIIYAILVAIGVAAGVTNQ